MDRRAAKNEPNKWGFGRLVGLTAVGKCKKAHRVGPELPEPVPLPPNPQCLTQ